MGLVEIAESPGSADPEMEAWISPRRRAIGRALTYMRLHSQRRLSLAEVASVAHMSQFHFSRSFHRIVGVTFQDHLVRLRLRNAERLFRHDPSAPLRRVAAQTGFGTLRNLQDHYGRVYGYPPSRGRAKALRDAAGRDGEHDPASLEHAAPRKPQPERWSAAPPYGRSQRTR
jgi:transcriptional regulator GlxA family with amidase domain